MVFYTIYLFSNYRLKLVIKCLLKSWRHYYTGRTTYKKILVAASQQTVFWQTLVRVMLSFYMKIGVELIVLVFISRQAVIYSRSTHFTLLLNTSVFNSFMSIRVCVVVFFCQKVKELLSCLEWRVSTKGKMMMQRPLPLTSPSSLLQRWVPVLCSVKTDRKTRHIMAAPDFPRSPGICIRYTY